MKKFFISPNYEEAKSRVVNDEDLNKYYSIFMYDWPEKDHYTWVITADKKELLDWARTIDKNIHHCDDDCRSYGCVERYTRG